MSSPNAFVKKEWEIRQFEQMPARNYLDVVDPCESCRGSHFKVDGTGPWEMCMRLRRQCLRRGEEHALPTIRRVCIDKLDEDRDLACVFETDGSDTVTWSKETTRCRVACDKCWSLAQCIRMKHTLDPQPIAFLNMDDAPGVTPAKRSCKHVSSPSGSAEVTPSLADRAAKQARASPGPTRLATEPGPRAATGGSSPTAPAPGPARTPTPPRPPVRPSASATGAGGARRSSPSVRSSTRSNGGGVSVGLGGGGGRGGGGGSPPPQVDKGKRPARRQQEVEQSAGVDAANGCGGGGGGGGSSAPRSPSPDKAAGTRAGLQFHAAGMDSDIYIERLRERMQAAAGGVKDASKHLDDLVKVKQHARAQIRDAERLLKMSEQKEQQVKAQLVGFKSEEAAAKGELKNALKGSAEKLKEEAARLIREAYSLP